MKRNRRKRGFGLAALLFLGAVVAFYWFDRREAATGTAAAHDLPAAPPDRAGGAEMPAPGAAARPVAVPAKSREDVAREVKHYFRRELMRKELALEQLRYGRNYWQAELGLADLKVLEENRAAILAEVNAEMNEALGLLSPGSKDEPLALEAFFGADLAGPNVSYLSAESRQRYEEGLAGAVVDGKLDAERLMAIATEVLAPVELLQYKNWNAPEAAALRARLIGFEPTAAEFKAILEWSRTSAAPAGEESLKAQLGEGRFTQLQQLDTPEMQTALRDIHRLGLAPEHARWLATYRAEAMETLNRVWADPDVSLADKEQRVDELKQTYRREIAQHLGLGEANSSENDLMP